MPYDHNHGHDIIPIAFGANDVEPALESYDPDGEKALTHLIVEHPDLYDTLEGVASELSGGDTDTKIKVLKGIARAVGLIEQRPKTI
jgi:hypothetical protein